MAGIPRVSRIRLVREPAGQRVVSDPVVAGIGHIPAISMSHGRVSERSVARHGWPFEPPISVVGRVLL